MEICKAHIARIAQIAQIAQKFSYSLGKSQKIVGKYFASNRLWARHQTNFHRKPRKRSLWNKAAGLIPCGVAAARQSAANCSRCGNKCGTLPSCRYERQRLRADLQRESIPAIALRCRICQGRARRGRGIFRAWRRTNVTMLGTDAFTPLRIGERDRPGRNGARLAPHFFARMCLAGRQTLRARRTRSQKSDLLQTSRTLFPKCLCHLAGEFLQMAAGF